MPMMSSIAWNDRVRLVFSDVDETIADLYRPAETGMLDVLTRLLECGIRLVLITGQSVDNVEQRVVMRLPALLRHQIAVGACSGAELWGYSLAGKRNAAAFYTLEAVLTAEQKTDWRDIVQRVIGEFRLAPFPPMPIAEFQLRHGEPWHVLLDDRGPQITIEFPNGYRLSDAGRAGISQRLGSSFDYHDMRIPVLHRAQQMFGERFVPVTPRLAGVFALDFALQGVSKTNAVEAVFTSDVLAALGFAAGMPDEFEMEVWGDRFSRDAGTDWLMCTAIGRRVRAISFRDENPAEFPAGYNICLWDGTRHLHDGLLEYLRFRP
jgi:hypothetical protein